MPGSLKVTCAAGEVRYAYGYNLASLNAQTKFTVSCWLQLVSWDAGFGGDFVAFGGDYPAQVTANGTTILTRTRNAAGSKILSANSTPDTSGHHYVISYDAAGTTIIYIDGVVRATDDVMGATIGNDQTLYLGWSSSSNALTAYMRDLAIWSGYSAAPADVVYLRDGVYTPASLPGHPATNWWSLQGTGTVTGGQEGLVDTQGGHNLSVFGSGLMAYDAHEIVSTPSPPDALFMPPYCDTTGRLIFIPTYLNPATTVGGPVLPSQIQVPPLIRKNGVTKACTLVPMDGSLRAIAYQLPPADPAIGGDTLTISAVPGWALTQGGILGGTSLAGLGSAPLDVVNYAGQDTEFATPVDRPFQIAYNTPPFAGGANQPGQAAANFARRLAPPWRGTVDAYNPTSGLPANITGAVNQFLYYNNTLLEGRWTLVYGDDTSGVTGSNPLVMVWLEAGTADWDLTEVYAPGISSPGSWDGAKWHGITKCYLGSAHTGAAGMPINVLISSTASGGAVSFPSMGNGQVELGIFPPSPADRYVSSPATWGALDIDPKYLEIHVAANTRALRWMAAAGGATTSGDSTMILAADLTQRQVTDFLWGTQTTTTCNITKIEPVGATWSAYIDYQGANQTMSAANYFTAALKSRVPMLVTTSVAHGWRSGEPPYVTLPVDGNGDPIPLRAVVVRQDGLTIASTSSIASSGSPVTFDVNTTDPPLAVGSLILIDSEQLTVSSVSGSSVTCTRGTMAAHAANSPIYLNFLTLPILSVSGTTVIGLSRIPDQFVADPSHAVGLLFQIGTEQVSVLQVISSTQLKISRGANGTTGATHPVNSIFYPCISPAFQGLPCWVTSSNTFVVGITNLWLPTQGNAAIVNPTIMAAVNYTTDRPLITRTIPGNSGSVPFEFAAACTAAVSAAKGSGTVLWLSFSILSTDALVTEVIANRTIPHIGPDDTVIAECSNEVWNAGFSQSAVASLLAVTAPNPEGPPYTDFQEFLASRQHHINTLAKDAFEAASLPRTRVHDFQPSHHNVSFGQGQSYVTINYCQTHHIPIDYISMDGYMGLQEFDWELFWTWMPTSAGGGGYCSDVPTARRMMMSWIRAICWFSGMCGVAIAGAGQLLSWFKVGKSVASSGVDSGWTNTGLGKIVFYEAASELDAPGGSNPFLQPITMGHDLVYDPEWYDTELAYFAAKQGAAAQYAALMPSASAPDAGSFVPAFSCLYASVYVYALGGQQLYPYFAFQGQAAGMGLSNTLVWDGTTPYSNAVAMAQDRVNESVRAQAVIDWNSGTTPTPTPTPTLNSIAVTPANPSIVTGLTQQFTATGHYSDSSTQNLTSSVAWASSNTSVATISVAGLAAMVGLGTSTITATF